MIRNLRCTVKIDSVLANSKTQNAFLFTVNAIFRHDYLFAVEPGSTPRLLVQKKTWRNLLICSFLPCLSWLLRSRVRKSRRDLWITLYIKVEFKLNFVFMCENLRHILFEIEECNWIETCEIGQKAVRILFGKPCLSSKTSCKFKPTTGLYGFWSTNTTFLRKFLSSPLGISDV